MQAEIFGAHIMAAGRDVANVVVSHDGSLARLLRQVIANQCEYSFNNGMICYQIPDYLLYTANHGLR
jgi:hypothetical protein